MNITKKELTLGLLAIICFAAIGWLLLYFGFDNNEVAYVAQILSGFAIVLTLIITCVIYMDKERINEKNNNSNRRFEINKRTVDMLLLFSSEHMLDARAYSREIGSRRNNLSDIELITEINENQNLQQSVIELFNYFSLLDVAIELEVIDKNMVIKTLGETIINIIDRFSAWNVYVNKDRKDRIDDINKMRKLFANEH